MLEEWNILLGIELYFIQIAKMFLQWPNIWLSGLIFLSDKYNFIPAKDLFSSNILYDVAQYSLKIAMTHSHHIFIFHVSLY